nr:GSU2403 family nucleotidyltransferase fold protein [uncultured Albidiferax sp.]
MNDLEAFAKLVQALDAWRGQLVFIGGWSHRLHTLHPYASQLEFQPVFTKDTDLAFHNKVPLEGNIKDALIEKGFKEDLSGEARPPAAHYKLGNDNSGFYAEFLTPLVGSGIKRTGEPDATMLAGGISAQKIRHLGILLTDPWTVTVGPMNGVPLDEPVDLQVANPLCFMVQKFLIKKQRTADKHRQDLLYVFDTIQLFGHMLPAFKENWEKVIAPSLEAGTLKTVVQECGESFNTVTDTIRDAASIPQDRRVDPEELRATCQYAFQQILGL